VTFVDKGKGRVKRIKGQSRALSSSLTDQLIHVIFDFDFQIQSKKWAKLSHASIPFGDEKVRLSNL